ncbi:MAG: TraR/DksA family transcriptional regulator [Deltaproteobacteria bacterium]|nr:MAG: TraR/DksA family transcriptional regulator [Deltaproteobacteria bacterium]
MSRFENAFEKRPLTKEELEQVKKRLLERKKKLLNEIADILEKEAKEEYQELIETIREEGDIASAELQESTILALAEMRAKEVEQIDAAIERIDNGEYGICIDCGDWITPARLEALPYALRCKECQERIEKLGEA